MALASNVNKIDPNTKYQVQEYFKCKSDPIYFIEHYIKLELPGGDVLMKLYRPQKRMLLSMVRDHFLIALKSRQIGISTLIQAFIVYIFVFYKNVVVGIVSRDGPESTDFCRKVIGMIKKLPDFMRPKFEKDTEQTFILDNGCQLYASQVNDANPGALFRGKAITLAIIDEAAFIPKIDDAYTGFAPALFKAQKVAKMNGVPFGTFIISTPNRTVGIGKWYYSQWKYAHEHDTIYIPHKIHWKEVEEFANDPTWYKQQCDLLHNIQWKIDQELEMKFVASSDSFFSGDTVSKLNSSITQPMSVIKIDRYNLHQYALPNANRFYLIGIDIASSGGNDYSALQVVDYESFEQVAEFKDKLRVDEFCRIIDLVNKIYPNNLIVPESNSYGNQVCEFLTKTGTYYRIYQQKLKNVNSNKKTTRYRYGLWTGPQTRPLLLDALYTFIEEDPGIVKGERTILELIGLVRKPSGRVEADESEHDDLSFALGFCAYVKMYDPPMNVINESINKNLVDQIVSTIEMNQDGHMMNASLINLSEEEQSDRVTVIARSNKVIHKIIKDNLFNLSNNSVTGNSVDVNSILGFNVRTGQRKDEPGRTKQMALDQWNFS